ncbi:MAG: metal-dependent hydrolase [Chloroflexota bacterium]|nr:metal-dependent hydrolase [Chloroflexota bacterium]
MSGDEGIAFVFVHARADFSRLCRRIWLLLYCCLARLVAFSRQRISLLAVIGIILIVLADAFTTRIRVSQPVDAVFDEPAHIATGLLLLGFLPASLRARYGLDGLLGALLGAVLIDIDHLPQEFGHEFLTRGTDRPYPHSLLTLFIVLIVVALLRGAARRLGCGFAFGLAAHFLRDLATNRVPLGWPLTSHGFHLPYGLYAVVMLLALAVILWRDRRKVALYGRSRRPILSERPHA